MENSEPTTSPQGIIIDSITSMAKQAFHNLATRSPAYQAVYHYTPYDDNCLMYQLKSARQDAMNGLVSDIVHYAIHMRNPNVNHAAANAGYKNAAKKLERTLTEYMNMYPQVQVQTESQNIRTILKELSVYINNLVTHELGPAPSRNQVTVGR